MGLLYKTLCPFCECEEAEILIDMVRIGVLPVRHLLFREELERSS
jgi:hypothetical protein